MPAPCGTIFSILLIIAGFISLFFDSYYGISLIVLGFINLIINEALQSSDTSRGTSPKTQNILYGRGTHLRNTEEKIRYYCPKCKMEFTSFLPNSLCPSCQIPLKKKIVPQGAGIQRITTIIPFKANS